jgi:hypothetical protein
MLKENDKVFLFRQVYKFETGNIIGLVKNSKMFYDVKSNNGYSMTLAESDIFEYTEQGKEKLIAKLNDTIDTIKDYIKEIERLNVEN